MPANKPALVQPFPTEARSPRRTRFDDMINVETREVSVAVFSDRELYDLEMERIFSDVDLLFPDQIQEEIERPIIMIEMKVKRR